MGRTALRIALVLALTVSLSVGSLGFTAVEADRTVNVAVVEDDDAFVSAVACEVAAETASTATGASQIRVWVTNRYPTGLTVTEIASDDAKTAGNGDQARGEVRVGERERFTEQFTRPVDTVTVSVIADGLDATVTQTVETKHDCPYTTSTAPDTSQGATNEGGTEAGGEDSEDDEAQTGDE